MCSALEKRLGVTFPTDLGTEEARQFFVDLVRMHAYLLTLSKEGMGDVRHRCADCKARSGGRGGMSADQSQQ